MTELEKKNLLALAETEHGKRFFKKVVITQSCWLWVAGKNTGYGWMRDPLSLKNTRAHRWLKIVVSGPVPEGKECCHTCNVRSCVNPDHIYYGTRRENMRDITNSIGHNWSRFPKRGSDNPMSILTDEIVLNLRRLNASRGLGPNKLEKLTGINRNTINNVLYNKKRWRTV